MGSRASGAVGRLELEVGSAYFPSPVPAVAPRGNTVTRLAHFVASAVIVAIARRVRSKIRRATPFRADRPTRAVAVGRARPFARRTVTVARIARTFTDLAVSTLTVCTAERPRRRWTEVDDPLTSARREVADKTLRTPAVTFAVDAPFVDFVDRFGRRRLAHAPSEKSHQNCCHKRLADHVHLCS